jgi:hypothetical protein
MSENLNTFCQHFAKKKISYYNNGINKELVVLFKFIQEKTTVLLSGANFFKHQISALPNY